MKIISEYISANGENPLGLVGFVTKKMILQVFVFRHSAAIYLKFPQRVC